MDDQDVFAVLTPCEGYKGSNAETAFRQPHNAARCSEATGRIRATSVIGSRDATPAPPSPSVRQVQFTHSLVLRFSDSILNAANGVQFGRYERCCDVLIQCLGVKGVSGRHFAITVKEDGSWYLEDFFSTFGTAVGYDGKAASQRRTRERWIIAHPPSKLKQWNELIVYAGDVAFKIDFPNQATGPPQYMANLESFIQRCRGALPALSVLGLDSNQTTAAPSQRGTPDRHRQPIYVDCEEIGRGAFATVLKVMSGRDGLFYAMKKFFRPPENPKDSKWKRKRDSEVWYENKRKEARIMQQNAHPSVVPVIDVIEEPGALSIVMPYYTFGSLQHFCPTDKNYAYTSAFLQILLALSWLHSRGLVHRDIKPENFLLESLVCLKIVVADFGLSKVTTDHPLTTFCGTLVYCAPEVFPGNSHGYGPKADVWSLGVMMLQLMFGLPDIPDLPRHPSHDFLRKWVERWSMSLQKEFANYSEKNNMLMDILRNMIMVDPQQRFTADQCLQNGLKNGLFGRHRDGQICVRDDTEVHTPAKVSWQVESPGYGEKTPTPQSPQLAETTPTEDPFGASILSTELWLGSFWEQCVGGDRVASANASPSTGSSDTRPRKQRRKINNTSNSSHCASGVDVDRERNSRTSAVLGDQCAPSRGPEEEHPKVRQGSSALSTPGEAVAGSAVFNSAEISLLELLASG
ncbi:MAG: hypothetical protein M1817_004021 [Caeruleum heppii]|nr:MAG: hypothetical protein M1817_004021 [Caeruleum heppii]